jgi:serine/threonine-protein kinase
VSELAAPLEIGHVLLLDIVGYSKLLIDRQRELLELLNQIVRASDEFRRAELNDQLVRLPTGDGMALVFFRSPEAPARCAVEIAQRLKKTPQLAIRMGIHSGPVDLITDVNHRKNIAGAGINMAKRVMDLGDAGHILLSKRVADDLAHYQRWQPHLHELGEFEVKHGVTVTVVNLVSENFGNPNTPEKLKNARHARAAEARVERRRKRRKQLLMGLAGAAPLAVLLAAAFIFLVRRAEQTARSALSQFPAKSVAVLPFENLSQDQANSFLAGGIQDEIITHLAKIGDLKVISRTSTMQYGSKPANLKQIAKELGVAAILEGSVQKVGDQVHVNVQLIKAATDAHLWADTYDRELIDLLKVQSDVAQRIAAELNTTLTADEKTRIEQKTTSNPEAYALYLRGTELLRAPSARLARMEEGQRYFEQAIALDPSFALAHARLAQFHTRIALFFDPSTLHKEKGRTEAEQALQLEPKLSEAHVALGLYYGRLARDYDRALQEYELAKQGAPNDVQIIYGTAHVQMKRGQFRAAISNWERAVSLDPLNWNLYDNLGNVYSAVGMYAAAERAARREMELVPGPSPEKFALENHWAWAYYDLTGSFEKLDEIIARNEGAEDPNGYIAATRFDAYMARRNYADAERAIASSATTIFEPFAGARATKNFYLGQVATAQGDIARARPFFEKELEFARKELNESPDSADRHQQIGLVCAYLGRKDEAIAEGQRAIELMPVSKDAVDGPNYEINLAQIYALVGEPDKAIDLLETSLRRPGGITMNQLKWWSWDPLRNHPRFQKLISGPAPKIVYN